jgi:hypothetical protein
VILGAAGRELAGGKRQTKGKDETGGAGHMPHIIALPRPGSAAAESMPARLGDLLRKRHSSLPIRAGDARETCLKPSSGLN